MSKHILVHYIDRFDCDVTLSHTHAVCREILDRLKVPRLEVRDRS